MKLSDFAYYSKDKIKSNLVTLDDYITTDCLLPNKEGKTKAENLPPKICSLTKYQKNDILIGNIRPYLKKIWLANQDGGCSNDVLVLRAREGCSSQYIYYSLLADSFFDHMMKGKKGSKMPRGDKNQILSYPLADNSPIVQSQITAILSVLDDKITINKRINTVLEAMAKQSYDYWFVQFDFPNEEGKPYKSSGGKMVWNEELKRNIPEKWKVGTLLDIADYLNGLACQNYRPKGVESLRVIKIREMKDGFSANSELVDLNDIPQKIIIKNGDVLFSWSASLEVIIWSGGKGALNQHIFKVTSNEYPKSFYYFQLLNYLQHFKMMAENRKTTMGHITQEHLQQSRIIIPPKELTMQLEKIIAPIFEKKINNDLQNQQFASLRNWLLPLLMSGQVKVKPQIEESVLNIAAEPVAEYGKQVRTIPVDAHILGGHIVNRLHKTRGMGRTKLQKALHLVEYHCQMELNSQSMQFAAGPHDQEMMNYIDQKFFQFQHVKKEKEYINGKTHYKYIPTNRIQEIECAYKNIDCNKRKEIDNLLDKIATMDLARAEIVSTLYAVWNNRLIVNQTITDNYLLQDFYEWSKHKHDFPRELVLKALNYMRKENIVPVGWGKYIDKRE